MAIRAAVFGDIHGKQDLMYETARKWEQEHGKTIDLILQTGEFGTICGHRDLKTFYGDHFRRANSDFEHYYPLASNGKNLFPEALEKMVRAPKYTAFVGGNTESWAKLQNKRRGGLVAYNICYLGRAGFTSLNSASIAGLTGIYSEKHYDTPLPAEPDATWAYYRKEDAEHILNNQFLEDRQVNIVLLHGWITPLSKLEIIAKDNIPACALNTEYSPAFRIVEKLKPKYVFMGHFHSSYLEAMLGETKVFGLKELVKTEGKCNPEKSMVVVEV